MTATSIPVTRIRPSRGWVAIRWAELWEYRELLYFFVWRDLKVRYRQTLLGVLWAILQPVLTTLVFVLIFSRIAGVSSDGAPYVVFAYVGVVPWTMFSDGLTRSAESLVSSANLVRKVYFPRLLIPASAVLAALADFFIALVLLLGLVGFYGIKPPATLMLAPALLLLLVSTALGTGIWVAALNATYRDVRYVVPFFVQLWMFVTPVIYPTSAVITRLESVGIPGWLYALNPMVGVVEGFRWTLLGSPLNVFPVLAASSATSAALLVTGVTHFRKMERAIADVI